MSPQSIDHIPWVVAAGITGFVANEVVALYRIREGTAIGSPHWLPTGTTPARTASRRWRSCSARSAPGPARAEFQRHAAPGHSKLAVGFPAATVMVVVEDDAEAWWSVHSGRLLAWLCALALPLLLAVVCVPLRGQVSPADRVLLLALTVVLAGLLGGRMVGAVAALTAAFAFDFFHTRPYYSLRIDRAADIETAALLLVVGVVMGEVVTRARHYRRLAGASRQELQRVRYLAELAAGGEPLGRLIRIVRNQLVDLLHLRGCEFEYAPFVDSLPRLLHTGVEFPVALERTEQAKARAKTKLELPVWGEGLELGRFVLTLEADCTGIDFDSDARASALALADQLGVILLAHRR